MTRSGGGSEADGARTDFRRQRALEEHALAHPRLHQPCARPRSGGDGREAREGDGGDAGRAARHARGLHIAGVRSGAPEAVEECVDGVCADSAVEADKAIFRSEMGTFDR